MVVGRYIDGGAIKPVIVVWNKENKTPKVMEVTEPNDYGLNSAEWEKGHKI